MCYSTVHSCAKAILSDVYSQLEIQEKKKKKMMMMMIVKMRMKRMMVKMRMMVQRVGCMPLSVWSWVSLSHSGSAVV